MEKISILIVDDEPMVLKTLENILGRFLPDRALLLATTVEEALKVYNYKRDNVGLIVTDLNLMGRVDGLQLLEEVNRLAQIFTGAIVFSGYLSKPVEREIFAICGPFFSPLKVIEKGRGSAELISAVQEGIKTIEERQIFTRPENNFTAGTSDAK